MGCTFKVDLTLSSNLTWLFVAVAVVVQTVAVVVHDSYSQL